MMQTQIRSAVIRVRRTALLATATAVAAATAAHAQGQAAKAPPGIIEFAGAITRSHINLFDADARGPLDQLNRRLREANDHRQKARDDAARNEAAAKIDAAAAEFLALVEKSPRLIRVTIDGNKAAVVPAGPVVLPGDAGGLLLRIEAGAGETRCETVRLDLSMPEGESSGFTVNIAPAGVTWAIASLTRVPTDRTTLSIELKRAGQPSIRFPFDVKTPTFGRLRVTIRAADTGKPAPAMVRITWLADGSERMPPNALEFGPQFDRQGTASGRRPANLPGKLGGAYWCVPGPFDMAVPPGEYEIAIRRGAEHAAVFDTFAVESGGLVEKTYTPRRWIDMRKRGWYSGDHHVHCQILSDRDAWRLMQYVQAEDIHVSNIVKMGDIYRTYFEQRGFGKDYRVIDGDYVLCPGQECPRTHEQIGHTLAMNTQSMVRDTDKYFLYDLVFDEVHRQGGIAGYAHVCSRMFHVHRDMSINVPKGKADFAEVMQFAFLGTDLWYEFLNLGCKLTASAGSDIPWGGTLGEVRVYAYTGDQPFSADAWFDAFKRGRTFTTDGPMIELRVDDALPGEEIFVKEDRKLRVKARVLGDAETMPVTRLEIIRHGDVIQTVAARPEDRKTELTLDFATEAGNGGWLAARAWTADGRKGHTTPVYVVREGLRFWKYEAVDDLIARRLASLDEVEKIVEDAKQREAKGEVEGDRYVKQLAVQGPELMQRVEAARKIYAELKETAAKERAKRK